MSIGVIGAGKWGSALHFALSKNNKVLITSRTKRDIQNFTSLDEVLKCEYIVIAISAQHIEEFLENNFVYSGQKILVASKGVEAKSGRFLNQIYSKFIPDENLAFISGPSFASEVIKALPTALVINSTNEEVATKFASFFPNFIKTYTSSDVIGAEISGAYKNVIAIAAGVCEGLNLGKNAVASLISRGLVEMQRFGVHFGAKSETFSGLSGAGDLFLTSTSTMSRNFRVGLMLAQKKSLDDILKELGEVAEGVKTTYAIYKISSNESLHTPIVNEVYNVLEGKDIKQCLSDLLS